MGWLELIPFVLLIAVFLGVWLVTLGLAPAIFHLLQRSARGVAQIALKPKMVSRIARHERIERWRVFLPVVLILAIGSLVSLFAGDAFLDLVESLQKESPVMQRFDARVHGDAVHYRSETATAMFTIATIIGTPLGLGVLVVFVSIWAAHKKQYRWIGYLGVTAIGGGILNLLLKGYFERARPALSEALRSAHGYSFPSGHAMGSTVVLLAFSYLAFRSFMTWRARSLCIAAAITGIIVICASRIYLGVHWISDIAAGVAAGTLWTTTTTTAYETFRRIRRVRNMREEAV